MTAELVIPNDSGVPERHMAWAASQISIVWRVRVHAGIPAGTSKVPLQIPLLTVPLTS